MIFASTLALVVTSLVTLRPQSELTAPTDRAPARSTLASTSRTAAGERSFVLYDVHDFVTGYRPAAEPLTAGGTAATSNADEVDAKRELARRAELQKFAEFVLARLEPAVAADTYQLEVLGSGTFGLVAAADVHNLMRHFFDRQRACAGFVDVRVRIVEGSREVFARAGFGTDTHAAPLPFAPAEIERRIALEPGLRVVQAPQLTTRPLQHAELSLFDEIKYVADWSIETVFPGPTEIVVPKIGVVSEGYSIGIRAAVQSGDALALDLQFARSVLHRPIRTTSLVLEDANKTRVELALPEVSTVTLRSACSLPSGGTFAFVTPPSEGQPDLLILVSASLRTETPAAGR
jgi:hypothetical protein